MAIDTVSVGGVKKGVKRVVENRESMVAGGGENFIRLLPLLNLSYAEADIAPERMDETGNTILSEKAA